MHIKTIKKKVEFIWDKIAWGGFIKVAEIFPRIYVKNSINTFSLKGLIFIYYFIIYVDRNYKRKSVDLPLVKAH